MINRNALKDAQKANPFAPVHETVYQYLHQAILLLELKPGEKLRESQLAEELEISRSPVKAALQRLEHESLVERSDGKTYRVSPVQYEDCRALAEARKGIEGAAAYYAAGRITEKELGQLKALLLQFRIGDRTPTPLPEEFAHTDGQFHRLIVRASRNPYLADAYGLIESNMLRYRLYIMRQLDIASLGEYESHLPIYFALKNRSAALAREEMLLSINHMYDALRFL